MSLSFLCISEDFKGSTFMTTVKSLGHKVFLLTEEKNRHEAWPRASIDEIFYSPDKDDQPHNRQALVDGTAWLMREHGIDCIVALDDFDVEDAALLREEFRISGMGQTTARHFRDKLAMRLRAQRNGIPVPAFSALFRPAQLEEFCAKHPGPYVIKPRDEASAAGIRKVADPNAAREAMRTLGDQAYRFLIETFAPGRVYHVDALVHDGKFHFVRSSAYGAPPLQIVQGGGIFQTRMLDPKSKEAKQLEKLTKQVMDGFGMKYSASHTEFIQDAAGNFLFLETSSRVGGAYIANMIEHATGVDMWSEWARIELSNLLDEPYELKPPKPGYAAVTIKAVGDQPTSLDGIARSCVAEDLTKRYHVGRVFRGNNLAEVAAAQDEFAEALVQRFR